MSDHSSSDHPSRLSELLIGGALMAALSIVPRQGDAAPEPSRTAILFPRRKAPTVRDLITITRQTFDEWNKDGAPRLGAALAFYSILSIGPLLLLSIWAAGLVFGEDNASRFILDEMRALIGNKGAGAIEDILNNSQNERTGLITTIIGFGTLAVSASGFFDQLQTALNIIWNVPPQKENMVQFILKRLLSFGMVLGIGLLLLMSLVLSAGLTAFTSLFGESTPAMVLQVINLFASFVVTTLLFGVAFNILPDKDIPWRDVWLGAAITALLFAVGKTLIGLYLGSSGISSSYGAAGSLIVLLIWVYYSAQIVFFGAEFTQVYSTWHSNPPESQLSALPNRGRKKGSSRMSPVSG